ncbi:hypothetical protein JTB14_026073 [Gonioctena quinquepunctata]|nr:hypothetical protein JTB14_026073 [Gonioctena quinquepunctata]
MKNQVSLANLNQLSEEINYPHLKDLVIVMVVWVTLPTDVDPDSKEFNRILKMPPQILFQISIRTFQDNQTIKRTNNRIDPKPISKPNRDPNFRIEPNLDQLSFNGIPIIQTIPINSKELIS